VKILLLTHKLPYPLHDGYNLHNFNYVKRLRADHEFHLVSLGAPPGQDTPGLPAETAELFASIRVLPSREQYKHRGLARLLRAFSPDEVFDFDPAVYRVVSEVVSEQGIELVWSAGAKMLVYSDLLGLPTLGDIADEAVKEARHDLGKAGSVGDWVRAWRTYVKTWRFQRKYLQHVGVCTVVSQMDKQTLASNCPGLQVRVVPNGVDYAVFAPQGVREDFPSLVFEGAMDFLPNRDGIQAFVHETLPLIHAKRPEVKLFIVGKNPVAEVKALASDRVTVTGFVDDVKPWVEKASVFVCPLKRGAGIKNKILQAWSLERPVVATSVSCGGLPLEPGVNIEVADEPRAFADKVLALLDDPERRRAMGTASRRTIIEKCSWEVAADAMDDVLYQISGMPKQRA
jgi:glycosyltransferase involved in cell wall biosynthesis